MPTEVFDDTQDLVIGLLEAELPASVSDSSYPYPRLKPTGKEEVRTFRTLILENDWLRLTVLPDLGGRLHSVIDKRTGTEILPFASKLAPIVGGKRGAILASGIELYTQGAERLNSLGPTSFAAEPAAKEDLPAGIWLGESVEGTGLSFHLHYSLAPERPEFSIEAKVFNRTSSEVPYNGAFAFHVAGGSAVECEGKITFFSADRNSGFWIDTLDSIFDGRQMATDLVLARFPEITTLAPRQVDTFSIRIVPFSGLRSVASANREAAASIDDAFVRIQTSQTRLGHKLLLLTEDGKTLEAQVDLYPERILEIPMSDLPCPAKELVLQSPSKQEVIRAPQVPTTELSSESLRVSVTARQEPSIETSVQDLRRMTFDVGKRHVAFAQLARKALSQKEYRQAEQFLEQVLLYNAEDHLAWWTKAMAGRLREGPGEERPEILNAHFLAPFEPALRAEAFLAQNQEMGKDPSPLLAPLNDNPEAFVEVAALLTELGLNDQATRWIDEALRHSDMAMLHYLQAFCYLRASRMHVEAGECVAAAARLGFSSPLPWRDIEWEAIATVHARFPDDAVLSRYVALRSQA